MMTRQQLIDLYEQACEVELQAFKPGNVSVYNEGHDMTVEDFRISYTVSSVPLTNPDYCVGEKIYYAVKATREAVGCNTNLGIILLCAPLLQAAMDLKKKQSLRDALKCLLNNTNCKDANWMFKAITLATPGGLGDSESGDVKQQATMTLMEAMSIAAHKDRIAYQFLSYYKDIFEYTFFVYNAVFARFGDRNWAALSVFSALLSRYPDSHIERKYGTQYSDWVTEQMTKVHKALVMTDNPESLIPMLYSIDKAFKSKAINPGTTADMTVATVLVYLLEQLVNGEIC